MAPPSDEAAVSKPSPSDAANESPPAPPLPSSSSSPSSLVAAASSRTDAFLAHLQRCLQTRAGADAVLLFLCYASRLGGSVLEALSRPILRLSARRLVAAAFKLPPATTVILTSATPQPPLAALALRLGGRLKALSAMISETRTVGRLWGLLGLYFAAKRLALRACGPRDSEKAAAADDDAEGLFDTGLAVAQMTSLVVFQAAENVAYLSSKKILPYPPATQGRLALLSVRAWGLYVGMEMARLLIERSRKAASARRDAEWVSTWRKSFFRNLSWAPLTVHWSSPEGLLPDLAVSLLAAYPATGAMVDLWRETA